MCIDGTFLTQVIKRGDALLNMILTNQDEVFRMYRLRAALAAVTTDYWSQDPERKEQAKISITTVEFFRDFGLFRGLL